MQHPQSTTGILAGVVIALAYFLLAGYLIKALRQSRRLTAVIGAFAGLLGVLPAILYAASRTFEITL
ncbi:hypothetical protein [Streptomyces violascens]|uniref:hypothetical protein n=1 Tax=Streptomyces violascens TaxID=67381 RepID=UPI0036491CB6